MLTALVALAPLPLHHGERGPSHFVPAPSIPKTSSTVVLPPARETASSEDLVRETPPNAVRITSGERTPRQVKKIKSFFLEDGELSTQSFSQGKYNWFLVENYEAFLWKEERQDGVQYLGPFLIQPRDNHSPEGSALVYDPQRRKYGVVSGQLLVHKKDLKVDCQKTQFQSHPITACHPHLDLVILRPLNKDLEKLQWIARQIRQLPGVVSVEIEILTHFQEKI